MSAIGDAYDELDAAIAKVVALEWPEVEGGFVARWIVAGAQVLPDDGESTAYFRLFPAGATLPMDMSLGLLEITRLRLVEDI